MSRCGIGVKVIVILAHATASTGAAKATKAAIASRLAVLIDGVSGRQSRTCKFFDCSWSLLNHGVAERMRLNLGNLNPIYERELIKLGVDQKVEGS